MDPVFEGGNRSNMTGTTSITQANGILGIFVASASSAPTIAVTDTAGGVIAGVFTPLPGVFYPLPCSCEGLTVTIANTVNCTVFWK